MEETNDTIRTIISSHIEASSLDSKLDQVANLVANRKSKSLANDNTYQLASVDPVPLNTQETSIKIRSPSLLMDLNSSKASSWACVPHNGLFFQLRCHHRMFSKKQTMRR